MPGGFVFDGSILRHSGGCVTRFMPACVELSITRISTARMARRASKHHSIITDPPQPRRARPVPALQRRPARREAAPPEALPDSIWPELVRAARAPQTQQARPRSKPTGADKPEPPEALLTQSKNPPSNAGRRVGAVMSTGGSKVAGESESRSADKVAQSSANSVSIGESPSTM